MRNEVCIRELTKKDAAAYRTLRLQALKEFPEAFGASYETSKSLEDSIWEQMLSSSTTFFGAFSGSQMVGTANLVRGGSEKTMHRGDLYGLYVSAKFSGTGIGRELLNAAFCKAKSIGILQVHIGVTAINPSAIALYEKVGFESYGTKPRNLIVGDNEIDEYLMVKFLDR